MKQIHRHKYNKLHILLVIFPGDAILVDNAETLLSAVTKVVDDIQVATIEIKDHRLREKLGLKWVKRDVCTVKKFGPIFIPKN